MPGMWGLRGVRRARPRPALRDGAHAALQHGRPVAARTDPGVLLHVALRSAAFGIGVGLLRTGWGRRRSDRGTEVGEQEHGAQPPRGRAVGQLEGQRHLRARPSGAAGRPALCTLTSRAAQPQPWRDRASSRLRPGESWTDTPPGVKRWNGDPARLMSAPGGGGGPEEPVSAGATRASH